MSMLHAVVMAGGSGTRFWPASRTARPKQFLPLAGGVPLIRTAVDRVAGLADASRTWIVTNPRQLAPLRKALPDFPEEQVIVEPEPRDTAPCIALAWARISARDPEATMAVLPADHVIEPVSTFEEMIRRGAQLTADGRTLVTFGIPPRFPATGYGYIEVGDALDAASPPAHAVTRFREKPDKATAQGFLDSGRFLWNSGIFVWSIRALEEAMAATDPELARAARDMQAACLEGSKAACTRAFRRAPRTSIDFAVMEKAPRVAVVRSDLRWDDVGSFAALGAVAPADGADNVHVLADGASFVPCESRGNVVYAEGARTVALFGVEDLVVVAVKDAVLVCPRGRSADLKAMVEELKRNGREDLL